MNLRKYLLIFCNLFAFIANAQNAFHNFGNVQIHDEGKIGFHTHLINDGMFNQNLGLGGFYHNSESLTISGTQIPRFYNFEVDVPNDLFLEINTEVENTHAFINGRVQTPREFPNISLDYLQNSIYASEDDDRHVDGYASYIGTNEFLYPIGDAYKLRPLITPFQSGNPKFKAAYFNEDPNFPSTFPQTFDTNVSETIITAVNNQEFWDFNGTEETTVTLTWDSDSNLDFIVSTKDELRVVGWNIQNNQWEDLGNTNTTGTLTEGTITSFAFIPNQYEILTFGTLIDVGGISTIGVYNEFSPNDDGINDTFVIDGISLYKNELKIYNRWGNIVYATKNYQNDWTGKSNQARTILNGKKLPVGTYFYILSFPEEKQEYVGWVYINY